MFRVIGHHIPCLLGNIITIIVCLVVASNYDGLLTLYIALATLGGMGISLASRRIITAKARNTNGKLKKHHALCDQYVEMLPTAKTNDLLSYYTEKSSSSISDFIRTSQKEDWTTIFWTRTVSNYNLLISILLSVFLIVLSADSTVNLVFFSMVAGIINSQSQSAELLFQQIVKAEVSFENVERLCEFPSIYGDKGLDEVTSLSFRKVSFVYQSVPNKNILQDITCSFKPGDLVMLKGENGSGKSTFIKLITGIYAPTEGKILINGQDHFSYSHRDLNKQILYIGQEEKFLNESFVDYMRIITGKESFSLTEWEEWMEKLGLSLSDRNIEACGENLSVGQRKKLLILKMMQRVREASVIILDEVMAGLDTETQEIFIEYVKQLSQTGEKIIFLIEHSEKCGLEVSHELEFKNGMIIK